MKNLKNEIKGLVKEQIQFKLERKTSFTGERKFKPSEAAYYHFCRRIKLRHYYIAYGFLKGKTIDQIEKLDSKEFDPKLVEDIMKMYTEDEIAS